jgi:hypothetical protein
MAALPPKDPRRPVPESLRPGQAVNRAKSPLALARRREEERLKRIVEPPKGHANQSITEQYAVARERLREIQPTPQNTKETKLATPAALSVAYWRKRQEEHLRAVAQRSQEARDSSARSRTPQSRSRTPQTTPALSRSSTTEPYGNENEPRRAPSVTSGGPRSSVASTRRPTSAGPPAKPPTAAVRPSTLERKLARSFTPPGRREKSPTSIATPQSMKSKKSVAGSQLSDRLSRPLTPSLQGAPPTSARSTGPVIRTTRAQQLRGRSPTARTPNDGPLRDASIASVRSTPSLNSTTARAPPSNRALSARASSNGREWNSSVIPPPAPVKIGGAIPPLCSGAMGMAPPARARSASDRTTSPLRPPTPLTGPPRARMIPGSHRIRTPSPLSTLAREAVAAGSGLSETHKTHLVQAAAGVGKPAATPRQRLPSPVARRISAAAAAVAFSRNTAAAETRAATPTSRSLDLKRILGRPSIERRQPTDEPTVKRTASELTSQPPLRQRI